MSFTVHYDTLNGRALPRVVRPVGPTPDVATATAWFKTHRDELLREMRTHGALLFRGFPIGTAEDFAAMVKSFDGHTLDYIGGAVPRSRIHKDVFNATELTRLYRLPMHNELAYQRDFPDVVFFYSHIVATTGGETPIVDCRRIYEQLDPALRKKFIDKGLLYVRSFQNKRPLREWFKTWFILYQHLTWQDAFKVTDRAEAERLCLERGMQPSWSQQGDLIVSNRLPAAIDHPHTGEKSWFNQVVAQHFNLRNYRPLVYTFRSLMYRDRRLLPNQVYFGDGSPISKQEIHHIMDVTDRNTVEFQWQAGDVLLVDNQLVAHSRNPFSGPRKVMVAMLKNPASTPAVKQHATAESEVAEPA